MGVKGQVAGLARRIKDPAPVVPAALPVHDAELLSAAAAALRSILAAREVNPAIRVRLADEMGVPDPGGARRLRKELEHVARVRRAPIKVAESHRS